MVLTAVVVAIAPLAFFALTGDDAADEVVDDAQRRVSIDPLATVRAAVSQTSATGSFEMDMVTISTTPAMPAPPDCGIPPERLQATAPAGRIVCPDFPARQTRIESRSIVNFEPYAMVSHLTGGSYRGISSYWNATRVWLVMPNAPPGQTSGVLLTDFAGSIVGALGRGPGALTVIQRASPSAELNLMEEAVAAATPAGTGTVGDVPVTYYDVTIDITAIAATPGLNDVQRAALDAAIPMLMESGYEGTTERIAIDEAGYIREITAMTRFTDGSTAERHAVLSNFGCAPKVWMPGEVQDPAATAGVCPPPSPTTSTSTATTTTAPAPTTTSGPNAPTSTAAAPSTSTPTPPSTSANPTTTSTGPP